MSYLKVNNLSVGYGKKEILKSINLEFQKGKLYGILGPNGAGKSTFLAAITRLIKIKNGNVCVKGKDIINFPTNEYAKLTSMMCQSFELKFPYTIREIVAMGRYPFSAGRLNDKDNKIIENSLEKSDLSHMQHRRVTELSGGEKQRVLFGKTLCQDSDIILIDEGFSNADIYYQLKFIKLLKKKVVEENKLVIFIMHDLSLARKYCDELLILKNGEVYDFGKSEEVLNDKALKEVFNVEGRFVGDFLELD
jgi:iron complex transport system ATP-binding protein